MAGAGFRLAAGEAEIVFGVAVAEFDDAEAPAHDIGGAERREHAVQFLKTDAGDFDIEIGGRRPQQPVAHAAARKTDNALDRAGDQTADKTHDAAGKTRIAASDTAITTKVKADLVKEPNLDSLGIHVETEKGVVMLSGFVNSKEEADKAVKVAKGVDGVTSVKSAIKVK